MANTRTRTVLIESAIAAFRSEVKLGPEFVEIPFISEPNTDSHDTEALEDTLDDNIVEEGDEHTKQITGGPQASMPSVENPEALKDIICVTPAEGQKPLNVMTDPNFEAMSNPDKFPYAEGTFSTERPRKLTYRKYFNQRLLDIDGRFARVLDYLFVAQYIVEAKQVLDDGNNFVWRQKPSRQFTASQARDQIVLSQFICKDKAYCFMKNILGSPPYYQRTFSDFLAMIRQLGTPTWFFTLSAADLNTSSMEISRMRVGMPRVYTLVLFIWLAKKIFFY